MTSLLSKQDLSIFHGCLREVWDQDRALRGSPTCRVFSKEYADADPANGYEGTPTEQNQFTAFPCYYRPYREERIANSGGLLQPSDLEVTMYDAGSEFEPTWRIEIAAQARTFEILSQEYHAYSDRLVAQCRPIEEEQ